MSQSIKFTQSPTGALTSNGNTSFSDITNLGALANAYQYVPTKDGGKRVEYATDTEGLTTAIDQAGRTIDAIQWGIQSVTSIIALCDNQSDIQEHLTGVMWLITGLSELSCEMRGIAQDMQYSLDNQA